uniref:Proliferation associated protein 2G4 n=1 Tax=Echinococcus granulosus TaxID=6210 RepID=A0A068W7S0_ECHGR|nr:Proliferation associated protein 2G4 [Echinococcus granulosus]
MSDYESDEEPTAADETVLNKYKLAGEIVHTVLKELMEQCVPGAKIIELCEYGDRRIVEETNKLFKKEKEMKKGVAFPTAISVNNFICHYSPISGEENIIEELNDGDLVKIDLGAHIDGFSSVIGHTFVIGASPEKRVTGRKADVIVAANVAVEVARRLVKPGNENYQVSDMIAKAVADFDCRPIQGVQSHLLKKLVYVGEKSIVLNPDDDQKKGVEKCIFKMYEAWLLDIVISTGSGKPREHTARTTLFRKNETLYHLKMKASRKFYSEVSAKFQEYPFNIRSVEDIKSARYAVTECASHNVITPMPVLVEKEKEFVAQFRFTVVLMPNGLMKITGLPFDSSLYKTDFKTTDAEVKELLSQPVKASGGKKKKPLNAGNDQGRSTAQKA